MVLRSFWMPFAILLTLVGIGIREPGVAAVGLLLALTDGVGRAWARLALERVEYTRTLSGTRAFVGETVDVTYRLINRKTLPLPWIDIRDHAPESMPALNIKTGPSGLPGAVLLHRSTSLTWHERVTWHATYRCTVRGHFRFGPAVLTSGDLFGLYDTRAELPKSDYITVLPRLYDLEALGLPSRRPFGDERGGSPIHEDPSRLVGVRDYRAGDPMKRIEWKATARRGMLQSRVYDPSSSLHLLVALNVNTLEHVWEGYDPVKLERAISMSGSVARWAHEHRYAVGLVANSSYPGADRAMRIPSGRDPEQLTRILEALAMISPLTIAPLEQVLEEEARKLPMGATLVMVAAYCDENLAATLLRLDARGLPLIVVWVSDDPPPDVLAGLNLHNIAARIRGIERADAEREAAEHATPVVAEAKEEVAVG